MSGHSHWASIKHKKGALDAKRGKLWSKIARMIIVAAKSGGGDLSSNLTLRYAVDKAKAANMPKDTIEKAIKRGTGEIEGASFESIQYEGYGPGGVAIIIEVLTDNRNRTGPEVKRIFEKHGASLGTPGCVSWMFNKKGMITVPTASISSGQGARTSRTWGKPTRSPPTRPPLRGSRRPWKRRAFPSRRRKSRWCPRRWSRSPARRRPGRSSTSWKPSKTTTTCRAPTRTSIFPKR
jgi:hypothetical protein